MNTCALCHGRFVEGIRYGQYSQGVSEVKAQKGAKVAKALVTKHFCCEDHLQAWLKKEGE